MVILYHVLVHIQLREVFHDFRDLPYIIWLTNQNK
jgi:hypothetical protein